MDAPVAEAVATIDDLGWIATLYQHEDWQALIGESRRILFEDPGADLASLVLASAYHHTGRRTEAEAMFFALSGGPLASEVLLHRAYADRDRDPRIAIVWLQRHERAAPEDAAWRDGSLARLHLRVGDIDEARRYLPADDLIPARVPRRHPWLGAATSAVVPGLGQLIAGQPVEAASALSVVGTLAGGVIWALASDRDGTAVAFGAVSLLFWTGNVYGGADAAVRWNRHQIRGIEASLDRARLPGSAPPPLPAG